MEPIFYQDDEVSDGLEPDGQPAVGGEGWVVARLVDVDLSLVLGDEPEIGQVLTTCRDSGFFGFPHSTLIIMVNPVQYGPW